MCTVTVFPPLAYVGIADARSGIALMLLGLYASSGRWVA